MFKPIASKITSALKRMREYDPELEYLNDAQDIYDLERRHMDIDRGRFRRRYPYYL
ncbi:hypothetical protein SAMN02745172_00039 [Pseudoxanthobacter soli DSM 19599]|uniref:DUF3563 domain-containing protein n=1 Tax=Pseudoxanthobacter soli DSM 19599 TaxID=1123029 RepID=A0A1M7Z4M1_9HYPH|nr:DUF3563 domain-containing protein [Pseudoxanthobacter soli]SHO59720.1 hypothetical protein SAMN02745172_00039 [Pseudoxanthobacter soli DSM 19599]